MRFWHSSALAALLVEEKEKTRDFHFYTSDERLRAAAKAEGFTVD